MTNKETLELLKPIMLDGSEKVGDKVYCTQFGEGEIKDPAYSTTYPLLISFSVNDIPHTKKGSRYVSYDNPTVFKCNPFEWLASRNNNQERVIEVMSIGGKWTPRVLIKILDGHAVIWRNSTTIEEAKSEWLTEIVKEWREVPTEKVITKEEALKMLAEKGVDTTNLIIE